MVTDTLRQRSYETKDGENRTVAEMEAEEVGASMKYATVKVAKVARTRRATPTPDAEQGGSPAAGEGDAPF